MKIYAQDPAGPYLGLITPDQNHPESIVNRHGDYGSSVSLTSIRNPNCMYGSSAYGADYSAFSDYANHPPLICQDGAAMAALTVDSSYTAYSGYGVNPAGLIIYLMSGAPTPIPPPTPTPTPGPTPTPTVQPIRRLVTSFYELILGRDPEPGAVDSWHHGYFDYALAFDIDVRFIPREMARLFFLSKEYESRGRSRRQFVMDCYRCFLNRDPGQTEIDNWLGGVWNQAQVMTVFSESEEFAGLIEEMYPGLVGDPTRNFVTFMYIGLLDRLVDRNGLVYAADLFDVARTQGGVEACRAQAKQMAREVIVSEEFLSKNPTTAVYVTRFYRAFLGRFPSDAEVTYWSGELDSGRQSASGVIELFADSAEFTSRLSAHFG